jgi:tetratricopeptide (TPR) repeat protein
VNPYQATDPGTAWAGIPVDHVVAVLARLPNGKVQIGSGFLLGARSVLTAEHCTRDKMSRAQPVSLTVVRKSDGAVKEAVSRLIEPALDLAVLTLRDGFVFDRQASIRFGRVDRAYATELTGCAAIGYPLFQLDPGTQQRNSAQLSGVIRTSDESETGRLLLRDAELYGVGTTRAAATAEPASPWGGLSGALVFYRGLALGVVIQHHPRQGPTSVLLSAFDTLASSRDPNSRAMAAALEMTEAAELHVAQPEPAEPISMVSGLRPNQLPIDNSAFVGRQDEIEAVAGYLSPHEDGSLVVVSGMPGVGKSALALRVAHRVAEQYPDGQLFVSMRGSDARALDPARVLADFLRALGVGETAIPQTLHERARLYRSRLWDRRVLVVLDNAGSEGQVRPLLPGAPTCSVLVTSRQRFPGLDGHQIALGELSPAAALGLLRRLVGDDRVDRDLATAGELAGLCGYLPLALKIAGARLALRPGLTVARFLRAVADERGRLDELETPDSAVRATLRLSVEDLDPADRLAFLWLGVLDAADFSTWALAALLDVDQRHAERRIESLLQWHMIAANEASEGPGERFRMHDLLRLYARELLEREMRESERFEALRRASRSFLHLALTAATALEPGEDFSRLAAPVERRKVDDADLVDAIRESPLSWFIIERHTLVIAVERMATQGAHELAIALTRSMTTFFDYHAHWDDWSIAVQYALTSARVSGDKESEAALLRSLSRLHRYRGDLATSDDLLARSLAVARAAGNEEAVAASLVDSIRLDWYRGRHAEAHAAYNQAMTYFAGATGGYGRARCWASIALVLRDEGRVEEAVERCEAALALFRQIGDRRWIAATLTTLADLLLDQETPADAERRIREAFPLLHDLGFRWWEAVARRTLGLAHADQGRLEEAEECLRRSAAELHDLNLEWWESVARVSLAEVLRRVGRYPAALKELEPAESVFRQRQDRRWTAIATVLRARVDWEDRRDVTLTDLDEARRVLAECGERRWRSTAMQIAAEVRGDTVSGPAR